MRLLFRVFILSIFLAISSALPLNTFAAQTSTKGLTLSPLREELSIAPGTSQNGSLKLTNHTNQPMTVHMSAAQFSVTDPQYDYSFDPDSDVAKWVTYTHDDVTLQQSKSQVVGYMIGVPLTAEPGGRYISLFATTDAPGSTNDVKSEQRIASLVYLTVTGDVTRIGKLISLKQPWLTTGQDKWTLELRDSGTTHYRSEYSVQVQTLFGSKVGSFTSSALVLPSSVRELYGILPAPQLPGLYKAVYDIGLGDTPAVKRTELFVYVPLWSVGAFLVVVAMAYITYVYVRSLRRKSN